MIPKPRPPSSHTLFIPCVLLLLAFGRQGAHARVPQTAAAPDQSQRQGSWAARIGGGRALNGTWTAVPDRATGAITGTWTLADASGRVAARGGWSAAKSARGWSGSWRAVVSSSKGEYVGTWSAGVDLAPDARLADLFARAVKAAVSGDWRAAGRSGTWSIRASE
jgi:hypothetical protein